MLWFFVCVCVCVAPFLKPRKFQFCCFSFTFVWASKPDEFFFLWKKFLFHQNRLPTFFHVAHGPCWPGTHQLQLSCMPNIVTLKQSCNIPFTHTFSALCYIWKYLSAQMPMEINIITSKTQCNSENTYANGMCKCAFFSASQRHLGSVGKIF